MAEAPLDASEASLVHWAKRRGTAREPTQGTSHTSGFGGSGKRRSSAREIALSLERFDKLFDKYEGFELHGEEGECDVYDLKDKIIAMVRIHSARTLPAHSARTLPALCPPLAFTPPSSCRR